MSSKVRSDLLELPRGGVVGLHSPERRFDQGLFFFAVHPRGDLPAMGEREMRGAVEERRGDLFVGLRRRIEQADEAIRFPSSSPATARPVLPLSVFSVSPGDNGLHFFDDPRRLRPKLL